MPESTQPVSAPTPQTSSATTTTSTARFTLPAEGFALADLFERIPDARVKCDSAVANPDDHALLVVETDGRKRTIDAALRSDLGVAAIECFGERGDSWTYRVTWKGHPRRLIQQLVAADVTLLSMRGRGGDWKLRLLTPDREGIARADEIMDDLDCKADCRRITLADGDRSNRSGLTDNQRETLVKAFEMGYYNIPPDVSAKELANDLGISHQALSERFRRAYSQLVKSEFAITETNNSRY